MAFNSKKRAFADAVLAGKSNRDAAIAAGYSAATASQAGSRLVKDKDVAAYLAKHRKKAPAKQARAKQARAKVPPPPPPPPPPEEGDEVSEKEAMTRAAIAAGFDLLKLLTFSDPKQFLIAAMNDKDVEHRVRVTAATTLMPFMHQKLGEGGKKDAKTEAAKRAASKFGGLAPPLKLVNGK
ncbi:terminase small subunit [Caballeronia sp. AZ7_KS35]|uniref:terminase small subunit n=1 Tax=Caballeronia sp. AZ7_KS35 TaxID=2921762 RepID=UPI00202832C1|nr:terminase small subunit [Caballeronia sp. AZ7_KS35]